MKKHQLIILGIIFLCFIILRLTIGGQYTRLDNLETEQQQAHYWDSLGNELTCELEARIDSLTKIGIQGATIFNHWVRENIYRDSVIQAQVDKHWNKTLNLEAKVFRLDREIPKPRAMNYWEIDLYAKQGGKP